MKLKYIFTALVAALTLAVGCEDDIETYLDEVRVSSSYVAIPAAGGSQTITVNAKSDWSFGDIPEWVKVSPTTGVAGETEVTFKAEATTATKEAMLYLTCDGKSQIINVLQQTKKVELEVTPLKEFLAAEVGPTVYRIAGTITRIEDISASYKNATLTISDDEGYSVYCYRFGPPSGKKIEDLGMEVGDFLTVEGQRGDYKGSPQMAQGGVFVSLKKSLIKVDSVTVKMPETGEFGLYKEPLPLEGGQFKVHLTCKGDGISVVVPDEAKSWLSVNAIETSGNSSIVTFSAAANAMGDRTTVLTFNTTSGGTVNSAQANIDQKGAILQVTVGEFLKAAVSPAQYRLTGTVKKISVSEQYNNADITVADALGNSVLVHRMKPASGKITDLTIGVGDKLTVLGQRGEYNGTAQMVNGVYESHVHYIPATIKEFLAKEVSDVEYIVTGKIVNIKEISASFKNATLTIADDEGTTLYVFRMKAAEGGLAIENIGLKVGDVLTVIGKRGEFNGSAQMVNGYYVSHEAGSVDPEPEPGDNSYSIDLSYKLGANAYDDGVATINGQKDVKVLKIGTSSKVGDITITIPAGSKRAVFYAVAWKGKATTLEFSTGGVTTGSIDIKANDGAINNTPYTLTVSDKVKEGDKYEVVVPEALPTDMDFKITTASGKATRAIIFGLKAFKE